MPLCIATLIAALVTVPPLASAWDGGNSGPACSRLHRGFATAATKTKLKSLHHVVFGDAGAAESGQRPSGIIAGAFALDESPLAPPAHRSPETRRGPPNRLFR